MDGINIRTSPTACPTQRIRLRSTSARRPCISWPQQVPTPAVKSGCVHIVCQRDIQRSTWCQGLPRTRRPLRHTHSLLRHTHRSRSRGLSQGSCCMWIAKVRGIPRGEWLQASRRGPMQAFVRVQPILRAPPRSNHLVRLKLLPPRCRSSRALVLCFACDDCVHASWRYMNLGPVSALLCTYDIRCRR